MNGFISDEFPMKAGVPQGSVLGPLLWLVYSNDALNIMPEADAFADDVTLSKSCKPKDLKAELARFNQRLILLQAWGHMWQVKFATHKTQLLLIWRSPITAYLVFGNSVIENSTEIEILGLCYDKSLSFHSHISNVARKTAGKLASLRRISWAVDKCGMEILYKSQVRSAMEFSPLPRILPCWTRCSVEQSGSFMVKKRSLSSTLCSTGVMWQDYPRCTKSRNLTWSTCAPSARLHDQHLASLVPSRLMSPDGPWRR